MKSKKKMIRYVRQPFVNLLSKKLITAILVSVVFISFIRIKQSPYRMLLNSQLKGRKNIHLYHDFFHDDKSESIAISYDFRKNQYMIAFYNEDEKLLNSYELKNWTTLSRQRQSFDIDGDGVDEFFYFTFNNRELRLNGYSFLKKALIINEPVFVYPDSLHPGLVPPAVDMIGFQDFDGDNFAEVVFSSNHVKSFFDSRLMVYSVKKKKNLYQSPVFKYQIFSIYPFNADQDPGMEYLLLLGHYKEWVRTIPSDHQKVVVLDDDFKKIILEKNAGTLNQRIIVQPAGLGSTKSILLATFNRRGSTSPARAQLINLQGDILYDKLLSEESRYPNIFYQDEDDDKPGRWIFTYQDASRTYFDEIDSILSEQRRLNSLKGLHYTMLMMADILPAGGEEILLANSEFLYVLDRDFKLLSRFRIEAPYRYFTTAIRKQEGENVIVLNTLDYQYQFKLKPNYIYQHQIAFLLFFIGILYLFLSLIEVLYLEFITSKILRDTAINKSPRGILLVSPQGKILFRNKNIDLFFKFTGTKYQNENIRSVFKDYPQIQEFMKEVIRQRKAQSKEIVNLQEKQIFSGQIVGIPIKGSWYRPHYFYFEIEDYSQPLQSDRLKVWSESVHKMVHDIKTPIATVAINLQLINYKFKEKFKQLDPELEKNFDVIEKELNRIREISKQFLRFTNLSTPEFKKTDIIKLINKILKRIIPLHFGTVNFVFYPADKEVFVRIDPRMIEMVFDIIIENGIQATNGEGTITIEYIKDLSSKTAVINISDNGTGIKPEIVKKIFEPFFTTKNDGTGLGLVFAQKILKEHGSKLQVHSEPNKGSTFSFSLPLAID
ncbi:MAG: hypothetical protein Kow00108_08420 [Calditrichia bacterium]